ncbi:MAG: hypothetical protein J5865_08885 [Lachnospiraceae bacterium]|nr:hypothetical protein [Lachnospiraceae bacterium]
MKKIFVMVLALCLALTVLPAAAEDFAGTWYAVAAGVTLGEMTLNADGTVVVDYYDEKMEGTWSADGDAVNVTIEGATLELAWNGTSLYSAQIYYLFLRTPGQVTADQLNAYTEDGTLPEGIDKDTMDGILQNVNALYSAFEQAAETPEETEAPAETGEEGKTAVEDGLVLSTLKENFLVRDQYGTKRAFYIAVLQNNSEVKLYLDNASLKLLDASGTEFAESGFFYPSGSKWLEPGETTLVGMQVDLQEGSEAANYKAEIPAEQPGRYATEDVSLEITGVELALEEGAGSYGQQGAWVTVTNNGSEPLAGFEIIAAFEDADGMPWGLETVTVYSDKLPAGSSYSYWVSLDRDVKEYCEANGITLTQVETYAWKEIRD